MGFREKLKNAFIFLNNKLVEATTEKPKATAGKPTVENEQTTKRIFFPKQLKNGQHLYKIYEHMNICIITGEEPDFRSLNVGDKLEFRKEPSNKYDRKAIAIYDGEQRLGYLYRGVGQDMAHDFMNRGERILVRLQEIDRKNKMLYMKIAYYKK